MIGGPRGPNSGTPWQYRSQSLPRLASGTAADLGVQLGTPGAGGAGLQGPSLLGNGGAAAAAAMDGRFVRAAKTVAECLGRVKTLSERVNSAASFRESCSKLLGAAFASSLALQELLSGHTNSKERDLLVQRFAAELQSKLLSAVTLVDKYGHEGLWHRLTRFEGKQQVAAKFSGLQQEFHEISTNIWDLIDPENRVKRNVQDPTMGKMLTTGNAFSRHTLRKGDGAAKVAALLAFPDEGGGSGQGQDGMVVWAADNAIHLSLPSNKWGCTIRGDGVGVSCLLYDARGFMWAGYSNGGVALFHVAKAGVAAPQLAVADATITALAVDPVTGLCWAGTEEGVVVIVRFTQFSKDSWTGTLDHAATLMAPGASLPSTSSVDSASSSPTASTYAPSSAAPPSSRRPGGSTASSSRRQQHHCGSSSTSSRQRHDSRASKRHHRRSIAEHDAVHMGCMGGSMAAVGTGSQRLKEVTIHAGPVSAIAIHAGRAYTAGGSNAFNSTLLVWDTDNYSLLRVISKRNSPWVRSPTTCMTMVHWASTRRVPSTAGAGSLSQFGSSALHSQDAIGSSNISSGHTRSSSAGLPEMHLITGHVNGNVVVWDPSNDALQPVLLIGPGSVTGAKKSVKAVCVLEELGVLACGHTNGRVYMRKLDPNIPLRPRCDGEDIDRWSPATFSLQAHRLGLAHMVGHGHMIVTSGKTGSIKLWPETTLRCLASEADVQLPYSRNPISEAVNSLLHRAGMMTSYPSTLGPAPFGMVQAQGSSNPSQRSTGGAANYPPYSQAPQQQQQQQSAFAGAAGAAGTAGAVAAAAAAAAATQQQQQQQGRQWQQQQWQGQPPPVEDSARAHMAAAQQQQREREQEDGSGSGYERLQASNWVIDWSQLNVDANSSRKVIGQGSYGRVQIGCYNQTDVAVKILTELGSGSSRVSGGDASHSAATWDKVRLEKLLHEVGILSTLRHPNVVLFMGVCLSPPAVVTEYCPLRSLYDVLKKATSDAPLAARLTWQRRLRMALDAAKGLVHLHNHKPTILHRDLKSPNLFVMTNLTVKVGDFNLSRYMALDTSYVQSSLELNPRWSAPEVIGSGHYSRAADVYSFGVVLWELLSWQEPWAEEGLGSYQIMTAVQQQGYRPVLPPLDQLPGQVGPAAAVAAYIQLMEDCWDQNPARRPTFDQVVDRLKDILKLEGPNQYPGTKACQAPGVGLAGAAAAGPPQRGVSETAAMAAAAAAMAAAAGEAGPSGAATPAAAAAAVAAGVGPGGCHLRSRSEVVGGGGAAGPETADLLQLGAGEDDLPGPSAPRPPLAALPPIPGTSEDGSYASTDGGGWVPFRTSGGTGTPTGTPTAAARAAAVAAGAAGAAALPPRPPLRGSSGNQAAAAGVARAPAAAASPFAAYTEEEPYTPTAEQQQQQQVVVGGAAAAGPSGSPFASQVAQNGDPLHAVASVQQQQQQHRHPGGVSTAAAAAGSSGASPLRGSEDGGGFAVTPRSSTGGRSPGASGIRPSPFASTFAAAALVDEGCSSTTLGAGQDSAEQASGAFGALPFLALGSSSQTGHSGSVTSPLAPGTLPVANLATGVNVVDKNVREALVDAAVDAASAVAADDRRKPRKSSSGTSAGGGGTADAAAVVPAAAAAPAGGGAVGSAAVSRVDVVESIGAWHRSNGSSGSHLGAQQQQQQQLVGRAVQGGSHAGSAAGSAACIPDLISLDSESTDVAAGAAGAAAAGAAGKR